MANPDTIYKFPDGANAASYRIVVLPAGQDANVDGVAAALANEAFANDPAENPEETRCSYITGFEQNLVQGMSYVIQARVETPALSPWNAPLTFVYSLVGQPGPGTLVDL